MQVVAGPKGCKEYRNGRLTYIPEGEPVPEMLKLKFHDLRRRERRGEIRINWDAEDPVLSAAARARSGAKGTEPEPQPPAKTPDAPSVTAAAASSESGAVPSPPMPSIEPPAVELPPIPMEARPATSASKSAMVQMIIIKTTRGFTQHMRMPGDFKRFLCGAICEPDTIIVDAPNAKACLRCARRLADMESEEG